jgi:hypothetical protein
MSLLRYFHHNFEEIDTPGIEDGLMLLRGALCNNYATTSDDGFLLEGLKVLVHLYFEDSNDYDVEYSWEYLSHCFNCEGYESVIGLYCKFIFKNVDSTPNFSATFARCHGCDEALTHVFTSVGHIRKLSAENRLAKMTKLYKEDLTVCGDVEANPGPVMSKFAISDSGPRYVAQGMFDKMLSHNHQVTLGMDG